MRTVQFPRLRLALLGFILGSLSPFVGRQACAQETATLTASTDGTVSLGGSVFSNTGQPLAGATVEVSGQRFSTTTTNSEGYFLVPVQAAGPVVLVVSFPEHTQEMVEIKQPAREKSLVITLQSQGKQKLKALRARQRQFQRSTR